MACPKLGSGNACLACCVGTFLGGQASDMAEGIAVIGGGSVVAAGIGTALGVADILGSTYANIDNLNDCKKECGKKDDCPSAARGW
jgi:hypothetical protein